MSDVVASVVKWYTSEFGDPEVPVTVNCSYSIDEDCANGFPDDPVMLALACALPVRVALVDAADAVAELFDVVPLQLAVPAGCPK